jgi:hypothetical protein
MGPLPRKDTRVPNSRSLEFVTRRFPTLDSRRSIAAALFLLLAAVFFFLTSTRSHLPFRSPTSSAITITQLFFSSLWAAWSSPFSAASVFPDPPRPISRSVFARLSSLSWSRSAVAGIACSHSHITRSAARRLYSQPHPDVAPGPSPLPRFRIRLWSRAPLHSRPVHAPHLWLCHLRLLRLVAIAVARRYSDALGRGSTASTPAAAPPRRLLDHLYHPASGHAE